MDDQNSYFSMQMTQFGWYHRISDPSALIYFNCPVGPSESDDPTWAWLNWVENFFDRLKFVRFSWKFDKKQDLEFIQDVPT